MSLNLQYYSHMDIGRLIQCVRGHVFLYDLSHRDYKNVTLKNQVWESIGRELGHSGDAVKSKWKTLRDGYTKYKKQVRELSGSRKKQHQYLWSSQLQFLDDYNLPKNDAQDGEISQDYMLPQINLPSPTNMPSPSQGTYDDRKRTHDGDVDEVMNYLSSKKQKDYDGVDHLFLSYADTFKKFSPRTQALLKLEMAKLFAGAELKSLKNGEDIEYDVNETDISLVVKKEDPL